VGLIEKHGNQLGTYRLVDQKKSPIDWDSTQADPSPLRLPGHLHDIVTLCDGDMIDFAGFKNHSKTALAVESVRLAIPHFKVHFFITEYPARMKQRLKDFSIDLKHPNLHCYQIDKSDYIPDKIESGPGVLNVIDHLPILDNFYMVGKLQDEIHRKLDGAICINTLQKKNAEDFNALGGSFWEITPTLAVTIFWDESKTHYPGSLYIKKGKTPKGRKFATGLELAFNLHNGCQFEYHDIGWERSYRNE
jgi:hypothetical protein